MPNMLTMQRDAEALIRRWGNNKKCKIIRNGSVIKYAYCARSDYKPTERGLYLDGSERLAISGVGYADGPDYTTDTIEFAGFSYKLNARPAGGRPDGTVVFYDCNVTRLGPATT